MTAESSTAHERPVPAGAPPPRPDVAVYVISVAADLAGLHPQTLRLYERKGLLDPARSQGGKRRYSEADMDRLRRIGELTAAGVSLEGVRRILSLEREVAVLRKEVERWRARAADAERRARRPGGRGERAGEAGGRAPGPGGGAAAPGAAHRAS
ncbi:MAG: heat shock protein transcriptional repressor HspR [Acidimicrobiia bacterium]